MLYQNRVMLGARQAAVTLTLAFLTLWGVPTASASADCSEASFRLAHNFETFVPPHAFVAADFNGDGTFRPRVSFVIDSGPTYVVAHDFNADGKTDLAASQTNAHKVAFLLNNLTTPLPLRRRRELHRRRRGQRRAAPSRTRRASARS